MNLTQKLYYPIKPFFPRQLQIALRRLRVFFIHRGYKNIWPINEKAGSPPEGWSGQNRKIKVYYNSRMAGVPAKKSSIITGMT